MWSERPFNDLRGSNNLDLLKTNLGFKVIIRCASDRFAAWPLYKDLKQIWCNQMLGWKTHKFRENSTANHSIPSVSAWWFNQLPPPYFCLCQNIITLRTFHPTSRKNIDVVGGVEGMVNRIGIWTYLNSKEGSTQWGLDLFLSLALIDMVRFSTNDTWLGQVWLEYDDIPHIPRISQWLISSYMAGWWLSLQYPVPPIRREFLTTDKCMLIRTDSSHWATGRLNIESM